MARNEEEVVLFLQIVEQYIESSSSDDEDAHLYISEKEPIVKLRNYVDLVHTYSEKQFKNNFRVTRTTCDILISKFSASEIFLSYNKEDHGGSKRISAEWHILAFIWFAANKSVMRDVAERFGLGETTLFRIIDRVMKFMKNIAKDIITFPKCEGMKQLAEHNFLLISGFPGVLGCIDGTSINVRTPAGKMKSSYCNRHDQTSITLQGICDSNKRFIDVFTGPPGKIHDSRVHNLSFISKELPELCGERYHLLGDSAYSIRPWLLTPYRDYGNLTPEQINYNRKFCGTRVLIENTFGLLKVRFRQLIRLEMHGVEKICNFIISCCVLHNICIDNNDLIDYLAEENLAGVDPPHENNENEMLLRRLGEIKRDNICNSL